MREKVKKMVLYGALITLIVNTPRSIISLLAADGIYLPPWLIGVLYVVAVVVLSLVVLAVYTALVSGGNR